MDNKRLLLIYGIGIAAIGGIVALVIVPSVAERRSERRLDTFIERRRAELARKYALAR